MSYSTTRRIPQDILPMAMRGNEKSYVYISISLIPCPITLIPKGVDTDMSPAFPV